MDSLLSSAKIQWWWVPITAVMTLVVTVVAQEFIKDLYKKAKSHIPWLRTLGNTPSQVMLMPVVGGGEEKLALTHSISWNEIKKSIDDAPPMQRADVAKHYIGIRIDWQCTYWTASDEGETFRVNATPEDSGSGTVLFEVLAKDHPELKVLRRGHPMRVSGTITNFESSAAYLKDVRLEILQPVHV